MEATEEVDLPENALRVVGTVEGILAAPDLGPGELMPIPEWGCAIRVRGLSKREQQDIRKEAMRGNELDPDASEMLTFMTGVVEPKFERKYYGQLIEKSSGVIDRVLKKIISLSGGDIDVNELKLTFRS